MENPLITVLMPVYNGAQFLSEAIESIIHQTYQNFEFIIINDGSHDHSKSIIQSYADPRIKLIENDVNIGLTKSLNKGLSLAKGKYIARMDADDVSMPNRFQEQINFLESHQQAGLVGSWFQLIRNDFVVKTPSNPEEIKIELLFKNPIAHPTTMFRKSLLTDYNLFYNETLATSQDHDLWYRFSKVCDLYNIPEPLLYYRSHDGQISKRENKLQLQNSSTIRHFKISDFLQEEVSRETFESLNRFLANQSLSGNDLELLVGLLNKLKLKNGKLKTYSPVKFEKYLNRMLKKALSQINKIDQKVLRCYMNSSVKSVRDIFHLTKLTFSR